MSPVLLVLRWLVPAIVPAGLLAAVVHRTDKNREPAWLVIATFFLAAVLAGASIYVERRAAAAIWI